MSQNALTEQQMDELRNALDPIGSGHSRSFILKFRNQKDAQNRYSCNVLNNQGMVLLSSEIYGSVEYFSNNRYQNIIAIQNNHRSSDLLIREKGGFIVLVNGLEVVHGEHQIGMYVIPIKWMGHQLEAQWNHRTDGNINVYYRDGKNDVLWMTLRTGSVLDEILEITADCWMDFLTIIGLAKALYIMEMNRNNKISNVITSLFPMCGLIPEWNYLY